MHWERNLNMKKSWVVCGMMALVSLNAFSKGTELSAEERQKMAVAHDKMAACLRTERPMTECEAELAESCSHMKGKKCPMMRGKKGHHEHHEHHEG